MPSEVKTRSRNGMVCPQCFTEGLEAHPGYAPDLEGDAEILRGTRCPNDSCEYHYGEGVPTELIQQQYIKTNLVKRQLNRLNLWTAGAVLISILGTALLFSTILGISIPDFSGGGADVTINGHVTSLDNTALNAELTTLNGTTNHTTTTNADGSYQLSNLTTGTYTIGVIPNNPDLAATSVTLTIADNGTIIQQRATNATLANSTLNITLTPRTTSTLNGSMANGTITYTHAHPRNLEQSTGVQLTISPPPGETVQDTVGIQSGQPTTINIPGVITQQRLTLQTSTVSEDIYSKHTWTGSSTPLTFNGNLPPGPLTVNISTNSNRNTKSITEEVSDGKTIQQSIKGGMAGPMTLTLWGGDATARTTDTGTYTDTNPAVTIDNEVAPVPVGVTLTGLYRTEDTTSSGTVNDGRASFTIDGTLPANNATIEFTGGDPESGSVGDATIKVDAYNGEDVKEKTLFTAETTGAYTIDYEFTETRNGNLVEAGYRVNNDLIHVQPGSGSKQLTLESGDTVSLWMKAEQESYKQEKDYQHGDHDIYVTNTKVSSTTVDANEPVTVTATLENRGQAYGLDVIFFTDGTESDKDNEYFAAGETKTLTFETRFTEEGTHTVSINEGSPISIEVGESSPSGAGELSGTAMQSHAAGTIGVDTNNDGEYDCEVPSNGGTCELGELSSGSRSIAVTEGGVTDTTFDVNYEAAYGAEDITVDIDADGVPEIQHQGLLAKNQTVSGTANVQGGRNGIIFDVGNEGEVAYEIQYTTAGQVSQPTLIVDGDLVVNETENFSGERSYSVPALQAGSHTFRFESANASSTFNAQLEWTESGAALYPSLLMNGNEVCRPTEFADDLACTIESPGQAGESVNLLFEGGAPDFEYGVAYEARATPDRVTLTGNEGSDTFLRQASSEAHADGTWEKTTSLNLLSPGKNMLQLESLPVDGMTAGSSARVSYTYQATQPQEPMVVVVNSEGDRFEKVVPGASLNGDGFLVEGVEMRLPSEWFTVGENEIRFVTSNEGVVLVGASVSAESEDALIRGKLGYTEDEGASEE